MIKSIDKKELKLKKWNSLKEAKDELDQVCRTQGFHLCSTQSLNGLYTTLYCQFAKRPSRTYQNTNKNDECHFAIKLTTKDGKVVVNCDGSNLTHAGHTIIENNTPITDLIIEKIKRLHEIGLSNSQIRNVLRESNVYIPLFEISKINRDNKNNSQPILQTDQIIEETLAQNGKIFKFEILDNSLLSRIAVISILPDELNHLMNADGIIFIDGTQFKNKLEWEAIPITTINNEGNIESCGFIFTGICTEKVISWIIESIYSLTEIKVIISDEDNAYESAIDIWNRKNENHDKRIAHILCGFHKMKKFEKKLREMKLTLPEMRIAMTIFHEIIYSDCRCLVDDNIEKLKHLYPQLNEYLISQIEVKKEKVCRAYIKVFTKYYNTSSVAESFNQCIKKALHNNTVYTLLGAVREFRKQVSDMNENRIIKNQKIRIDDWIKKEYGIKLSKFAIKKITKLHEKSNMIKIEKICVGNNEEEDIDKYVFQYHFNQGKYCISITKGFCNCHQMTISGFPCVHYLAFCREMNLPFPIDMIHSFWFINNKFSQPTELKTINNQQDIENNCIISTNLNVVDENNVESFVIHQLSENSNERFNQLMGVARSLVSKSSRTKNDSEELLKIFNGALKHFVFGSLPKNKNIIEMPGRPKGRPKKVFNLKKCELCDGEHNVVQCPFRPEYEQITLSNKKIEFNGVRCKFCYGIDHKTNQCPIKRRFNLSKK